MPEDLQLVTIEEEGRTQVLVPIDASLAAQLQAKLNGNGNGEEHPVEIDASFETGMYYPGFISPAQQYRSPTLSIPGDYYTQVSWAQEYYDQEPLVHSLINRDIDQTVTKEEFHLPEEKESERKALDEWRSILNQGMGQYGGLSEYNRSLMLDLILSSMSVTLANWGPIIVDGKVYQVPKALVNLNPCSIIPDIDVFSGRRKFYYMLSAEQYEAIAKRRKNSITEIIPDARSRITTTIESSYTKQHKLSYNNILGYMRNGYFLELPLEQTYVIQVRARQQDLWPVPTLVPIFGAIAMKRKLALADWSVADGMVNMIMVWEFPAGVKPDKAKGIVQRFMAGGRVQSHGVPAGVKVNIVTPDTKILDSSEKFWVPFSEILAHFGYPLNSKSRGAGDLDSGPLDLSSNRARLQFWRDQLQDHNNFWLKEISKRNGWDFDIFNIFQTRDLDDDANFRTFASSAFDRGLLSIETFHDLLNTSTEREKARRQKEKKNGLETLFAIRPSFSQTATSPGRPAKGDVTKPKPVGKGTDSQKGQSRSQRGRPTGSSQSGS